MKIQLEKIPYAGGMSFACLTYAGRECRNPLHTHPEFELIHFAHGRGQWIAGDAMGELHDGFMALFGANLPHLFRPVMSHPRPVARVLQFREDCLGPGFWALPEARETSKLLTKARRGLVFSGKWNERLRDLLAALEKAEPGRRLLPFLETLETAAAAARHGGTRFLASLDYFPNLHLGEMARINKVLDYMSARMGGEIYLSDVARVAGLGEAAFSRFFRRTAKKTFSSFLIEMRISQACRRLVETDETVTEVAYACGFGNLSNFNRRFLALRGETPTAFRHRRQQLVDTGGMHGGMQQRFTTAVSGNTA